MLLKKIRLGSQMPAHLGLLLLGTLLLLTVWSCKSPPGEDSENSGEAEAAQQDEKERSAKEQAGKDGQKPDEGTAEDSDDSSKDGAQNDQSAAGPLSADAPCTEESGAQLSSYLESMCGVVSVHSIELDGLPKADVETAKPTNFATAIRLEPGTLFVDGEAVDTSVLNDKLARSKDFAKRTGEEASVILAITADTPASEVVELINALQEKNVLQLQLIFLTGEPLPVEPADPQAYAALLEELAGKDASALQYELASRLTEAVGECAEQGEVFRALASASPGKRCQLAARGLGQAYVECGCKGDVVGVQNLMYRLSLPAESITLFPLTLASDGTIVEIQADDAWGDVVPALLQHRGQSVAFSLSSE